jgi:hypothetical protein
MDKDFGIPHADAELYLEEFYRHLNAGDDRMNARLRIIEAGCPVAAAEAIEKAAFPDSDEDDE